MRDNKLMKKILTCVILIFCASLCLACNCGKEPSISFSYDQITINIGDTYTINDEDIDVVDSESEYELIIVDTKIATIKGNVITPMVKGETLLVIQLKDCDVYCEIPLVITNIIYATEASIQSEQVQINLDKSNLATNVISLNYGCNEVPKVTYNENIIDYDYVTGLITAKSEGMATVVVLFANCNVSFNVNVVNKIYTRTIEVDDCSVYKGSSGKFDFVVFPETANTYEFFTTSELITIDQVGNFVAVDEGVAEITIKYLTAEGVNYSYKTFNVTIYESPSQFDVVVKNINGSDITYYLQGTTYLMTISGVPEISKNMLSVSNNIEVLNSYVESNQLKVEFKPTSSGEIEIDIVLNVDKNYILNETVDIEVKSIEDIEIYAIYFVYLQDVFPDGKYHIFPGNDQGLVTYMDFSLAINNEEIDENFVVYNVTGGTRQKCFDSSMQESSRYRFETTELGEYALEFELNGIVVATCSIVVENYN